MGGKKRQRQQTNRQARLAAAAAAQRRATRRRWALAAGSIAAVFVAIVVVLVLTQDDEDEAELATTATTAPAGQSAAGKPCVAPVGPLPPGAPAVPVKVGPPPLQLLTEDLRPGTGAAVTPGAEVTVNYIGVTCSTGKVFDSSYLRGQPATFPLSNVIPGWQQGIPGMQVGGQRLLGIPSADAYGSQGNPPDIAPNEPLWFVVEVLDAKPAEAATTIPTPTVPTPTAPPPTAPTATPPTAPG